MDRMSDESRSASTNVSVEQPAGYEDDRLSKIENADYLIVIGIGLIFVCGLLFCCKEMALCLSNSVRERSVRKKRAEEKLIEQRTLEGKTYTPTPSVEKSLNKYDRIEEIPSDPTTPMSPGGWKMARWNSADILYTYPTEIPLEDIRADDDPKHRRGTWHGGREATDWFNNRPEDDTTLSDVRSIQDDRKQRLGVLHGEAVNWRIQEESPSD